MADLENDEKSADLQVLSMIFAREKLLRTVYLALQHQQQQLSYVTSVEDFENFKSLLIQLREVSMTTVESILTWKGSMVEPTTMIWKGQNYLLKMIFKT